MSILPGIIAQRQGGFVSIPDPYYSNVQLLLHFNGSVGSGIIVDSSPVPKGGVNQNVIIAANGKFAQGGMFQPAVFEPDPSLKFNAYSQFDIGVNVDFCIEAWIYLQGGSGKYNTIFANRHTSWSSGARFFMVYGPSAPVAAQQRRLGLGGYSIGTQILSNTVFNYAQWYHVAVSRQGQTYRIFVNGVLDQTANDVPYIYDFTNCIIGRNLWDVGEAFGGMMDEFRLTIGVPRYTASFPVPTGPFGEN